LITCTISAWPFEHLLFDRHQRAAVAPPARRRVPAARPAWRAVMLLTIGHVQEGRALQADVDEGRLHAGQHARDLAQVDIADQAALQRAFDVQFLHRAVLDHGDPGLLGDQLIRMSCMRLAAGGVAGDLLLRDRGEAHARHAERRETAAAAVLQRHGGQHAVGAAGQEREHALGIARVLGLAEDGAAERDRGVGAEHGRIGQAEALASRDGGIELEGGHALHIGRRRLRWASTTSSDSASSSGVASSSSWRTPTPSLGAARALRAR
jgi:hypothetical protein